MFDNDTLTPQEASRIATNSYFTLKDWVRADTANSKVRPKAAAEDEATVKRLVLGPGQVHRGVNSTLQGTGLQGARFGGVVSGTTGLGTSSGFGYVMHLESAGRRHAILAMRGTRPEMSGVPDILTDIRGAIEPFGGYGLVHKGFKHTFDSVLANLRAHDLAIKSAHVVHCVGHSLGGGVATLLAGHYRAQGKTVKLYTFGSPRVGAMGAHLALQKEIGQDNIYRVAHDLDPITLLGPFPYVHLNPSLMDSNFMTIPSFVSDRVTLENHDMANYINSIGDSSWRNLHSRGRQLDHEDALLARWLLGSGADSSWIKRQSAKVLGLLFRLIGYYLRREPVKVMLSLNALDLLAEMLVTGAARAAALSAEIVGLLRHCATWAGIQLREGADIGVTVIAAILRAMLRSVGDAAMQAINTITRNLQPLPLLLTGAALLTSAVAL